MTRKSLYEKYGFTCNPSYASFNKELSDSECDKLTKVLEKLKQIDNELAKQSASKIEKVYKYC